MYLHKCTNKIECTLPGFDKNVAKLCTEKFKSTIVDNK